MRTIRLVIEFKRCPRNRSQPLVLIIKHDPRLTYRYLLFYVSFKTEVDMAHIRIKRNYWKVISMCHHPNVNQCIEERRAHVYYFDWVQFLEL